MGPIASTAIAMREVSEGIVVIVEFGLFSIASMFEFSITSKYCSVSNLWLSINNKLKYQSFQ